MKQLFVRTSHAGFALPTVIITSIVMMMILLSGLVAASSSSAALRDQYVNKISNEASQAGIARAKTCLSQNNYIPQWTNASPLKSNTDCTGSNIVSCTSASTDSRCFVLNSPSYQTNFEVTYTLGSDGKVSDLNSKGIVSRIRASGTASSNSGNSTIKFGLNQLLKNAGATIGLTTFDIAEYTGNNSNGTSLSSALCGMTTSGEVWCAGVNVSGSSPNASYGSYLPFAGGPSTCYASGMTSQSCGLASSKFYLTNLSSSSGGIFNGKTASSLTFFNIPEYKGAGVATLRSSALCMVTTAGEAWCGGVNVSGSSPNASYGSYLPFAGGPSTCYASGMTSRSCGLASSKFYLTNLSDGTTGIFAGKTASSLTFFNLPEYTGNGQATSESSALCMVTTAGEAWCGGVNVSGSSPNASYGSYLPFAGGPSTCYASGMTSQSCGLASSKFYLTNLSSSSGGIFTGKTMKGVTLYTLPETTPSLGANTLLSSALCGMTTSNEVWCAGVNVSGSSPNAKYNPYLPYAGGPSTCYSSSMTTQSCSLSNSKFYLTNLSDGTTGIFAGKTASSLTFYNIPLYNGASTATQISPSLCITTPTGEVWCGGVNVSGTSPNSAYNAYLSYAGGPSTCYSSSMTTQSCSIATSKFYLTNLSSSSGGIFTGQLAGSTTLFDISVYAGATNTNTFRSAALCLSTSTGEIWCAGVNISGSSPNTSYGSYLPFAGGPSTCYSSSMTTQSCSIATSKFYLTNLSSSSGGIFTGKTMSSGGSPVSSSSSPFDFY